MTDETLNYRRNIYMKKLLIPAAIIICAAAAIIMLIMLVTSNSSKNFTPPPFDPAAQTGTPDVPKAAGYGDLDAGDFKFYAASILSAADGKTDIWLTNPADNNIWLKVRILDNDENQLGESGLIKPGEYVRSVKLDAIPKATAQITLKVMAYEPDTYKSAGAIILTTDLTVK